MKNISELQKKTMSCLWIYEKRSQLLILLLPWLLYGICKKNNNNGIDENELLKLNIKKDISEIGINIMKELFSKEVASK